MSGSNVRTLVKAFLASGAPTESVVDLSGQFDEFNAMLADAGVQPEAPWLGIEFIGGEELPISLSATNDMGLYREIGSVVLHVCAEARIGVGNSIVTRGEALRNLFRGVRIGPIVIESVTPVNMGAGSTLEFDGGYVSGTLTVNYHCDISPGA